MKFLERIALDTPYLFLKKIPYAWIPVAAFLYQSPALSVFFLAIIAVGLLMMVFQQRAWEAQILREYGVGGPVYRVRPLMPLWMRLRNLALVLAGSALLGWLLAGRLNLTGFQWFLLAAGFMMLYKDALLFGASAVYLVTPRGIGIRYVPAHVDYRMFFHYHEMDFISRVKDGDKLPKPTEVLSPVRGAKKEGVLLKAKRMDGFSTRTGHILLTPDDPEEFLKHVPSTLVGEHALIR